ncbi:putative serine acetyltransferase [Vibrio parahaemolyticus 10290]|nr:putative serine acetyltransferase [Vibrio parahaemolyticus 10290]
MYVHGFRFYFTPLTGVLFAFPSRYWFTIGQSVVFSLGGWSPHIQTGYHVSRPTRFH